MMSGRLSFGAFVCAGLFALGVISFSSPARAACTGPAGVAGGVEWFATINRHLYCDGTNWRDFSSDYWIWNPADLSELYYSNEVGIKTISPIVSLDINGNLRLGYQSQACTTALEGALRYDSTIKTYQYCDGLKWQGFISGTIPPDNCEPVTFTAIGYHSYSALTGCTNLLIEAWGGGGGASSVWQGGGGGGASRVVDETAAVLVMAGGGGGAGYDNSGSGGGGGGGGGYARKTVNLTAGDELKLIVGEGGQSACGAYGGEGGQISGGIGGNLVAGGGSTQGGGGGGDSGFRGGSSTNGGGGGGGNVVSNVLSTTTYGGAGGAHMDYTCGVSTNGGTCGGLGEGGGGGGGTGDIALTGLSGDRYVAGGTPQSGTGIGAAKGTSCPTRAGNGQIKITPAAFVTPPDCSTVTFSTPGYHLYQVPTTCNTLVIDAYGAGGGGGYMSQGGGGGGSSRVVNSSSTILALGGGGGGGGYDAPAVGGGGGGGYARKTTGALTAGSYLLVVVGEGGEGACVSYGGEGGEPNPGLSSNIERGGDSVHGGGGGGDNGYRGGSSTNGGGGGGGDNVSNVLSVTDYGGAGGADKVYACGVSNFGGACSADKSSGGGGGGIGDTVTIGGAGSTAAGGAAANSGPGNGQNANISCPARGGNGRVVIDPQ